MYRSCQNQGTKLFSLKTTLISFLDTTGVFSLKLVRYSEDHPKKIDIDWRQALNSVLIHGHFPMENKHVPISLCTGWHMFLARKIGQILVLSKKQYHHTLAVSSVTHFLKRYSNFLPRTTNGMGILLLNTLPHWEQDHPSISIVEYRSESCYVGNNWIQSQALLTNLQGELSLVLSVDWLLLSTMHFSSKLIEGLSYKGTWKKLWKSGI